MQNRIFFPQSGLDEWMVDGTVDLQDGVLTILSEGRKYKLAEGVYVLREVSGSGDAHDLLGRVKTREYLEQLGAELVETSMLLGEAAYDVEPGWIGVPVGPLSEYVESEGRKKARGKKGGQQPKSEEEVLARFLAKSL
jgi:hypothetical protein